MLHSTDGGATWEKVETCVKEPLQFLRIKFKDADNGVISGQGFAIATKDGGKTWNFSKFDNQDYKYAWLGGIAFTGPQGVWAVGENGKIYKSDNNGESWKEAKY